MMPVVPAKSLADASFMKPTKKKETKKHLAEEASTRRRKMAAFDRVWGYQNNPVRVSLTLIVCAKPYVL
ncbi:hypothetical protein GN244_ATG02345 [Phytophthora infestans]|uniref:Uncharacterized protein n=1 Tax=Phytophthora infestans TaxID=4787 RepID=A0A833TF01_PHYIN|nr:hypothetical protein GN244_ATG02345 [Phytophthora infestans]KAF4133163.1 hypothetical protein GN958_ATG17650 [Phytophthora infestans]